MPLPEVKTQLKQNGRLAFLEKMYKIMSNKSVSEGNSRDGAYKFFKALVISNSFMACSRIYEIYRLIFIVFERRDDLYFLCSQGKEDYGDLGLGFRLSFAKAQTFFRLLMPTFFGLYCDTENPDSISFNQARELIKITNGKFGLFLPYEVRFLELVRPFAQRVNELECEAVVFEDNELPKMTLDTCYVKKLKNIDQLTRILRHDMKKLLLTMHSEDYLRNASFDPTAERNGIVENTTVEEISLSIRGCSHADQLEIVVNLLQCCPSLEEFGILTGCFAERRDFQGQYIIEQVLIHRNQINEMRSRLRTLAKKSLLLCVNFNRESNQEYNHDWFEQLREHFMDWSIDQAYSYDQNTGFNKCCTNLRHEDQGCQMCLHFTLNWAGERDEGLAMRYLSDNSDTNANGSDKNEEDSDFSAASEGRGDQV